MGAALFGYTKLYGQVPGGQAEFLRVPQAQYGPIKVPEGPPDDRFVYLSDVLPTAWQAVEYANIPDGGTVAVFGLGPIGDMSHARSPSTRGAAQVIGIDLVPERIMRARENGIEVLDISDHDDIGESLRELTDGRGPDSVIDAVGMEAHGAPIGKAAQTIVGLIPDAIAAKMMEQAGVDRLSVINAAIDAVRRGGTISLSGVYGGMLDPLPLMTMFDKQINLRMGQANVKRWIDDIMPLLEDERRPRRRGLRDAPAAARRGARGLRDVPEEAGRRDQDPAAALAPTTVCAEPVAGSAHGLDRLDAERPVDLLAQVADVDVDDVGAVLVLVVPRVLEQLEAVEHLAGAAHERLEQRELLRRQRDLGVAAADDAAWPGRGARSPASRTRRALDRAAAAERAQPRDELGERERLDEVVVGAAVEAGDAVLDRVARGEHEHGRPDAVVAQAAADLEAVDAGQHHVEHDRVVVGGARHPQRVLALDGDVGEQPLVAQAAADQARRA